MLPMRRTSTRILWLFLTWGCLATGAAQALDPPHDASQAIDCASCHITHHAAGGAITKIAGNPNLCMSCHSLGGAASDTPFADADQAIPGTSGTSHRWDSGASGWVKANPANTATGTVQSGGAFNGRYRKTYTISITNTGDVGTARFTWTASKPATQTYQDAFATIAYNGTNGTQNWSASPWQEIVETDGVNAGVVRVVASASCASGNCLRIGGGTIATIGVNRAVNASGATSAMLRFSYRRQLATCPNTSTANVTLQTSSNGTAWTTLATYNLNACDSGSVGQAFDITSVIAPTTQIRFLGAGTAGASDFLYVDDVQIADLVAGSGGTNVVTASGVALDEGVTVTFTNGAPSPSFKLNDQWTVYANPDVNQPASFALAARMVAGKVTCSTCHNEHSQVAEPFDAAAPPYPAPGPGGAGRHFQRSDDDINQMCVDCHSLRNVAASSQGSHPVGMLIPSTGSYQHP